MVFAKRLREGVRRGEITCTVRIWLSPRVRVGSRYRLEEGEIEVDSIELIGFSDITPALAHASGFLGVLDLLKVAKHGKGENIYLIRFTILRPLASRAAKLFERLGEAGTSCPATNPSLSQPPAYVENHQRHQGHPERTRISTGPHGVYQRR